MAQKRRASVAQWVRLPANDDQLLEARSVVCVSSQLSFDRLNGSVPEFLITRCAYKQTSWDAHRLGWTGRYVSCYASGIKTSY